MVNFSRSRPLVAAVLAVCVAAALPRAAVAESTRLGIDAEYGHDTNVNRAAIGNEEQSDDSVSVEAYAARSFLLSPRSGIVIRGALRATEFFDFRDLDGRRAGVHVVQHGGMGASLRQRHSGSPGSRLLVGVRRRADRVSCGRTNRSL